MKPIRSILAVILLGNVANAATVNWNAFFDTGIINTGPASSASALANGNWVQIGYFDSSLGANQAAINTAVTTDATTVSGTAALAAAFHTFGSLQISAFTGSNTPNSGLGAANAGGFQQTTNNFLYSAHPTFLPGSQIYIWALNSTNNSTLATAEASVTQQAIAYVPLSLTTLVNGGSAWAFPGSDTAAAVTIDITGLQTSGSVFLAGSLIENANNSSLNAAGFGSTNNALQLQAVVPEPSSLTLSALALITAAGVWRRRRGFFA